jgi:hypothetical protein
MEDTHRYRKHDPIWWRVTGAANRPHWIPKQRAEQAGEIKDVDEEYVVISVLNEERKEEVFMVKVESIRPRRFHYD